MMLYFYSTATGLFTGDAVNCSGDVLHHCTPQGCAAISGVTDWQAQRVDLAALAVVDYQPPAPADDALRTWAWNADTKRWVSMPTLAANKAARIAPVQLQIDALEVAQARALREISLAIAASQSAPAVSLAKLSSTDATILPLRAKIDAITACTTQAQLDAIPV